MVSEFGPTKSPVWPTEVEQCVYMLRSFCRHALPDWLSTCNIDAPLPATDLLANSVYYPACAFDGRPVKYCGGFSHSFVYVDYGVSSERLLAELWFGSYRKVGGRFVGRDEMLGLNSWQPILPNVAVDGDQNRYASHVVGPYAYWSVWERAPHLDDNHGPERFSFLYIAGDGAETFQSLYYSNSRAPSLVAIIQPGEGFGHNWTNFFDSRQILARSVLSNPYGLPDYLLLGGLGSDVEYQRSIVWPGYSRLLKHWKPADERLAYNGHLGLWTRIDSC